MASFGRQDLQELSERHGLLAAVLLLKTETLIWMGRFSQNDYAHLLLLSQTQSLPILATRLDAIQFSSQAVLVHSQLLSDQSLVMLVFPYETRLRELDEKAATFVQALEERITHTQAQGLLDGLRARRAETQASADDNLLALFTNMPEADPSNEATQPFRVNRVSVQTLEKSSHPWEQIF